MAGIAKKGHLPISRVNTIMKSSSDVDTVDKASSLVMSRAAELFIRNLAQEGYEVSNQARKLDYKHLAQVVHSQDKYNFLRDIMPKKITVTEYRKIMEKKQGLDEKKAESESSGSSSDDEADSSSDESNGSSASA